MDEKILNEAVENISLIKGVIERTSKSFVGFSRIFIYWGILFIVNSIFSLLIIANKDAVLHLGSKSLGLILFAPLVIVALAAALIYRHISKKIPLAGLEKHLMKIWMLILIMNIIPNKISIDTSAVAAALDTSKIIVHTSNFSVMIFSLAIALIATALFAGYKHLKVMGLIYIGISILHAYVLPISYSTLFQVLYYILLPFTFLYTGFFLKSQQARGN